MSAIHAAVINLLLSTPNAHDSVRLWVTCTVIAGLYLMSEFLVLPEQWHRQEFERFHAWLATALTATLLWYELTPVAVAVAWAVLGLVLYEYGVFRKAAQFRWQAYLVLLASFVRIFFANLTAGAAGDLLSSRMITVLPIAAIYYYVYARGAATSASTRRFASAFAYLGTVTIMALLYFQFPEEWVVTAWAALVMATLALALLAKQEVFAQHSVLISIAVLVRGMIHNLFGGSYFTGSDWRGRFFVVGSAVLLLFAALPLAFAYRRRSQPSPQATGLRRMISMMVHRAEQPIFFVAVALLTTMLALKMDHGRVTLAWGVEAVLIFIAALLVKERSFRLTGLALLLLCVARIVFVDVWHLAPRDKYLTFIGLGPALILVSFLYSKYRETIRQYL